MKKYTTNILVIAAIAGGLLLITGLHVEAPSIADPDDEMAPPLLFLETLPPAEPEVADASFPFELDEAIPLEGSSWQVGEMRILFQAGGNLLAFGPQLAEIAPSGAPGRYRLEGESLRLQILGRPYTGRWTGRALSVETHYGTLLTPEN